MKIGDLTLLDKLGEGTMGEVFLSQKNGSKEYYATKKIDRKKADRPQVRTYFINEIKILKELNHRKIVKYYDLKQTKSHYYIIMEYCNGGSIKSCLEKYKKKYKYPFSETIVQYLMKQIVSGLKYIHSHGIIHRDIKLDNILVKFYNDQDKKNINMLRTHIKITDFGISTKPGDRHLAFTAIGSPANMDPFILKKLSERNDLAGSEGYDQSADIWSLGSCCYEMLMGKRVFSGRTIKELSKKVEKGDYTLPTYLSKETVSFINGMLQYDPKKRLTCEQLSRHHFLTRKVQDFSPIDFSLIYSKIGEKGFVINTKENKTMWQVFNNSNTEIKNNNSINNIVQNNDINNDFNNNVNNNTKMWDIFNKETEIKLSRIPANFLDNIPFSENDTAEKTFEDKNNNNNINNKQQHLNNYNYDNIRNNNNFYNNQQLLNNYKNENSFDMNNNNFNTSNNNKQLNTNNFKHKNTFDDKNNNNFNINNNQQINSNNFTHKNTFDVKNNSSIFNNNIQQHLNNLTLENNFNFNNNINTNNNKKHNLNTNYNNENTFNISNNSKQNNYNNQINHFNSNNTINNTNYNNFNLANSQIPVNYKNQSKLFNGNNTMVMQQNQYGSMPDFYQNNTTNFNQGSNNNYINQTQIYQQGDIRIKKKAATTDESCMHQ